VGELSHKAASSARTAAELAQLLNLGGEGWAHCKGCFGLLSRNVGSAKQPLPAAAS
jgi:hypothetical protein